MDSHATLLSIITPTKDTDLVRFAVTAAAVLEAMQSDWEWLIVVHNSAPGTVEQIRQLIGDRSEVQIIEKHDSVHSPSSPRNVGLLQAKGKYVYLLDDDDLPNREFLDSALKRMERDACDLLIGSAGQTSSSDLLAVMPMDLDFPETEDGFILPRDPEQLGKLLVGAGAFLSSRVIRRSLLTENSIFFDEDLPLMEDHVFNARCYAHATRICVTPGIIAYTYVQHDGSLLQRVSRENADPEKTFLEPIRRVVRTSLDNGISPGAYLWLMMSFAIWVCRNSAMSMENKRRLMSGVQVYLPLMKQEENPKREKTSQNSRKGDRI
ncbi:MAG: glycosyltransferase [Oscillospiraceae bacterium]|nr:glycosyltransferase [Oscillospiraceae bacterium]